MNSAQDRKPHVSSMREVTFDEYLNFIKNSKEIVVEDNVIKLEPIKATRLHPSPEELTDVTTTVWSFPKRGSWATHRGDYRGNWPPQMARALILMYTKPGDTVLDPMVGSGTTCIEAKLLGRNCVGIDINYNAVILTLHRLYWLEKSVRNYRRGSLITYLGEPGPEVIDGVTIDDVLRAEVKVYHGDAQNLDKVSNDSIDLIATHPPYYNIIRYSKSKLSGDLSAARSLDEYLRMLKKIAQEAFRVLKPGGYLGILIGDTRAHKHYIPITHYALQVFLDVGFILKEEVIKIQHKMKITREKWSKLSERDFLLIFHEKLFILRKPESNEEYRHYMYSSKQEWINLKL